jgi:hypothetical protein
MLEQREGGCHCGRVRFRAQVDLEFLSQCNCSVCTKKGIFVRGRCWNRSNIAMLIALGSPRA